MIELQATDWIALAAVGYAAVILAAAHWRGRRR